MLPSPAPRRTTLQQPTRLDAWTSPVDSRPTKAGRLPWSIRRGRRMPCGPAPTVRIGRMLRLTSSSQRLCCRPRFALIFVTESKPETSPIRFRGVGRVMAVAGVSTRFLTLSRSPTAWNRTGPQLCCPVRDPVDAGIWTLRLSWLIRRRSFHSIRRRSPVLILVLILGRVHLAILLQPRPILRLLRQQSGPVMATTVTQALGVMGVTT